MTMAANAIDAVFREVGDELSSALVKFPSLHGPHEGYAVILEELDELWAEVKHDHGREPVARKEAVQVAAMALRYILDVTEAQP